MGNRKTIDLTEQENELRAHPQHLDDDAHIPNGKIKLRWRQQKWKTANLYRYEYLSTTYMFA